MRQIVNGLLLKDSNILLARRSAARANYPGCWSFPGGHVEPGESREEALSRELGEEIGVSPVESRLVAAIRDPDTASDPATYYLFAVTRWEGSPIIRDDEHSELRWFALAEAGRLTSLALPEYRAVFLALLQSESHGIGWV